MNDVTAMSEAPPSAFANSASVERLYTPLPAALDELRTRHNNATLCSQVAEFHRALPPTFLPTMPFAALGRYILTPSLEFDLFLRSTRSAGLHPLYLEYHKDIFLARNPDKYRLLRPSFLIRPNHLRTLKLGEFRGAEMRPLGDLQTTNGQSLVQFHHLLFRQQYPDECTVVDFSEWRGQVPASEPFYLRFLALFVCNGILFENFLSDDESEIRFVRDRVAPAFAEIEERFGVRPLIVRLLPRETEGSDHWMQLPGCLYPFAREHLRAAL